MCGWLLPRARAALTRSSAAGQSQDAARALPVLLLHGTCDTLVEFRCGTDAEKRLREAGLPVSFKGYKGLDHGHLWPVRVYQDEVDQFLSRVLESTLEEVLCGGGAPESTREGPQR